MPLLLIEDRIIKIALTYYNLCLTKRDFAIYIPILVTYGYVINPCR